MTPKIFSARLLVAAFCVAAGLAGGYIIAGNDSTVNAPSLGVDVAHAAPFSRAMDSADLAEMVMPSVVNISTDKLVERQNHPFMNDPFFRRFFERENPDGDSNPRMEQSLGSGVVISRDGYIVTNHHVVEDAETIRVAFNDRETYEAEIIGTDEGTDVALIKIDPDGDVPFLEFGDSDDLRVGERVMAVGNPFGVGQTVTMGIVSAKGRSIGLMNYEDHIQTDAAINPGNSGGAMVNMVGEVVGINSAILSRSGGSQGIGFAIPANMVQRILRSLREDGEVHRAWLGVQVREVNQGVADYYGLDKPRGVLVASVNEGTPAYEAGIEEGDIILAVDRDRVDTVAELRNTVSLMEVGSKVELEIVRDGDDMRKKVTLGELPDPDGTTRQRPGNGPEADDGIEGVTVRAITDRLRGHMELDGDIEGLLVTDVEVRSRAAREGLRQGDVILSIDKRDVADLDDYREAMERAGDRGVALRIFRPSIDQRLLLVIPQ